MPDYSGMTVEEILRFKKGDIKNAALDPGSPSWDDILHMTWEEVLDKARQREPGFQTIRKLLSNGRFNK